MIAYCSLILFIGKHMTGVKKLQNLSYSVAKNLNDYSLREDLNAEEVSAIYIIKGCEKYLQECGDNKLFKLLTSLKMNFIDVEKPSQQSVLLNIGLLSDQFENLDEDSSNNQLINLN